MPAGGLPAAIERPAFFRRAAVRPPMRFPTAWAFLLAKDRPHDFFRQALFLRPITSFIIKKNAYYKHAYKGCNHAFASSPVDENLPAHETAGFGAGRAPRAVAGAAPRSRSFWRSTESTSKRALRTAAKLNPPPWAAFCCAWRPPDWSRGATARTTGGPCMCP